MEDPTRGSEALEKQRPALLRWAAAQLPRWAQPRLDPEDLVQQTFEEVLRHPERLAGRPDHEVLSYLRQALTHNLIDALRKIACGKEEVSPEVAAASSLRLADWLAAPDTSPSERASREEQFAQLAADLARLPDAQRVAVELRYLQGWKVKAIARELDRTEGAVAVLLHRALAALRSDLLPPEN